MKMNDIYEKCIIHNDDNSMARSNRVSDFMIEMGNDNWASSIIPPGSLRFIGSSFIATLNILLLYL